MGPMMRQVSARESRRLQLRAGSESMLADSLKMDVAMTVRMRRSSTHSAGVFIANVGVLQVIFPETSAREAQVKRRNAKHRP